jgi:hypothetical protein
MKLRMLEINGTRVLIMVILTPLERRQS